MYNYSKLESKIQYFFKNKKLLFLALLHSSKNNNINNENLEFLGDTILQFCITLILFKKYKYKSEGFLSILRSFLVKRDVLFILSKKIKLYKFINANDYVLKYILKNKNVVSNCFEALLGAIFLDSDFKTVFKFIKNIYNKFL